MTSERPPTPSVDVVVVGSGIAGLTFALQMARGASVLLLTKKERAASNTNWARGGIAAVVGPDDDPTLHVGDTLVAGAGLCHGDIVARIVTEGPARIADLARWGAAFHRDGPDYSLGREGGHSRRRIVHARLGGGVASHGGHGQAYASASGSLIRMGGSTFAAREVNDAFAVVTTDGLAGVPAHQARLPAVPA